MPSRSLDFDWAIRRSKAADTNFLIDSWMKCFNEQMRVWDRRQGYWQAQKAVIAQLLEQPNGRVYVVCRCDNPDDILGYVVGEANGHECVIHYAYVKKKYRRAGVGNALMSKLRSDCAGIAKVVCTHEGDAWTGVKRKSRGWTFAPRGIYYRMILQLIGALEAAA